MHRMTKLGMISILICAYIASHDVRASKIYYTRLNYNFSLSWPPLKQASTMALLFYAMNSEIGTRQLRALFSVMMLILTSNQHTLRSAHTMSYELIYTTDVTTELTGSITMFCRTSATAENIPLGEVKFWLNRTTCDTHDPSLRQRTDVNVLVVDNYRIKFNLTRSLEGYYTCGKHIDMNCVMSNQKELICKCIPIATI